MNLVLTLLIELAILMSGCLAYLQPGLIGHDTQHTSQFFNAQISKSGGSTVVLSTIRTILDSLLTYHLPAEVALQSIDDNMKREIELQYNRLIDTIDRWLAALNQPVAVGGRVGVFNEGALVTNLFQAVFKWASDYRLILSGDQWTREYHGYVHQKLFVVMLHASIIAQNSTVLNNYEMGHEGPTVQSRSILSAATFMSRLDMDRICVCEGIMLSVFLKRPYPLPDPYHQWRMADIKQRLEFQSMWDDFGLEKEKQDTITTYTENTVIPNSLVARDPPESDRDNTVVPDTVPQLDLAQSHVSYVYRDFAKVIQDFQDILKDKTGMKPKHRHQLVTWTKRVWDRLCEPITVQEADFKSNISKELQESIDKIGTTINSGSGSDAGPSQKN